MRATTVLLWLLMELVLGGCTEIRVHQGDGSVTTDRGFGAVTFKAEPGSKPVLFQAKGVGIVTTGDRFTLGYVNADYAVLPIGDCRIVVWIGQNGRVQALDALRDLGDSICLVGPGALERGEKGKQK